MTRRPARTLLELCVVRAGGGWKDTPRGVRVCELVIEWALASRELGHFATTAEYAGYWRVSMRSGWYHRSKIHELFPGEQMDELVMRVVQQLDTRVEVRGSEGRLLELVLDGPAVA